MKFSYSLIKRLVPQLPVKSKVAEQMYLKSFETEDAGGDLLNIEIPHNRYSDASSHLGVAREASAIFKLKLKEPEGIAFPKNKGLVRVETKSDFCPRYAVLYSELGKVGRTPEWMKQVLVNCGLKPINPVVDIMNYVMLEVGQPLHAFDADKVEGGLVVRLAKKGEKITTLDGQNFVLGRKMLVIADSKRVLAIAGVKGGKYAEVDTKTKRILVEAANFDRVNIYQTSRELGLTTDASSRFGHGISPALIEIGLSRTAALLEELLGAKILDSVDANNTKISREIIGFSIDKFNSLIGLSLDKKTVSSYLARFGFKIMPPKGKKDFDFLVEVPAVRTDVAAFEDLVEEVARLYGYNELRSQPPLIGVTPATEEDSIQLKDTLRTTLVGFGFSEVYNYSFTSKGKEISYELENPIASDKRFLREKLQGGLQDSLKYNGRFFNEIRIFEIGKTFNKKTMEELHLGLALKIRENPFLELKGAVEHLFRRLGVADLFFKPEGGGLKIESDGETLGEIVLLHKDTALAEINLDKLTGIMEGEYEYRGLPKYPAVMRDLSLEAGEPVQVGDILNLIEAAPAKDVRDVELIDYYDPKRFTFRIIFQSDERTLTDEEVNKEMEVIVRALKRKVQLRVR